jgi:protoporphyrinogen oxidase
VKQAGKAKTAIIIGGGPAGLTAAYELLHKTDIKPIVYEASADIGGISKTITYKGNRMDIGGHRFFSKSDTIMNWWHNILPIEKTAASKSFTLNYHGKAREMAGGDGADPHTTDDVMLVRSRLSRIFYGGKFYNYPITLEASTIKNLGPGRMVRMGTSYIKARIKPIPEKSLEDFYVNRFGRVLYNTFFRDYTQKVWGVPCAEIAADWGAQRVKGLSVTTAVTHAVKKQFKRRASKDISQKDTETSLIEYFLYPKLGPGHMWETVAKIIRQKGGIIHTKKIVTKIHAHKGTIVAVDVLDQKTNRTERVIGDYFFSTMPINELIAAFDGVKPPKNVRQVAAGLPYRDFITVGLEMKQLLIKNETGHKTKNDVVPDNWIYIQEPNVKVGRLQVFNNWSPYLVRDENTVWIGMEYFVNEGDELWNKSDEEMSGFAIDELARIKIINKDDVLDSTVVRIKKTYPAYFGTYDRIDEVRQFTNSFENLFLLGRNGQHRYNNQDHSMLTAMEAVRNIISGRKDKDNVWNVNAEKDYHETK